MNASPSENLLEQQVELNRIVLELRSGITCHLAKRVLPHLAPDAQKVVRETIAFILGEAEIDNNLSYFLDVAVVEVRNSISIGTIEEKIAIPRERLISRSEAFDIHRRLTPEAEALKAALPPLEQLYHAVRRALDFAEAIKLSLRMFDDE